MPNYATCRLIVRGPIERVENLMAFVRGNPDPVSFPRTDKDTDENRKQLARLTGHQAIEAAAKGLELAACEGIDVGTSPSEAMILWLAVHAADEHLGAIEHDFAFSLNRILPIPLSILMQDDSSIGRWISNNWGDKWCELNRIVAFDDGDVARRDYVFTTPWKETLPPMISLMEQFDDLDIVYLWTERGNDLAGIAFRNAGGEIGIEEANYGDVVASIRDDEDGQPSDEDEDDLIGDSAVMEYLCQNNDIRWDIEIEPAGGVELF